jgi:hypothetical protein
MQKIRPRYRVAWLAWGGISGIGGNSCQNVGSSPRLSACVLVVTQVALLQLQLVWVLMRVRVHLPLRVVVLARRVWRGIRVLRSLGVLLLPSPEIVNAIRRFVGHGLTISAFPCYYTKMLSTPRSDIVETQLVEGRRVPEICPSVWWHAEVGRPAPRAVIRLICRTPRPCPLSARQR